MSTRRSTRITRLRGLTDRVADCDVRWLLNQREVGHGAIKFSITLVELRALKEKDRKRSRGAAGAADTSSSPPAWARSSAIDASTDRASFLHGLVSR